MALQLFSELELQHGLTIGFLKLTQLGFILLGNMAFRAFSMPGGSTGSLHLRIRASQRIKMRPNALKDRDIHGGTLLYRILATKVITKIRFFDAGWASKIMF